VPAIQHKAEIDVRAPAAAAFAIVAGDVLKANDDPDAMARHRPLDAGPLRQGFRWQQTVVHERLVCRTDWVVTAVEEPRLLAQTSSHLCAVAQRVLDGGERWEFDEGKDGSTRVTLHSWRVCQGLGAWIEKVFGSPQSRSLDVSLRKWLAYVQFTAERQG
jgi:hypothetical protein